MTEIMTDIHFLPKQELALQHLSTDSTVQQVLYGGSAGSGKTKLGCMWQIIRRIKYHGTRSIIGRSQLTTLKKSTLNTFFEVANEWNLKKGIHYNVNLQTNVISFWNGSEIYLMDLFAYPSDPNFDNLGSVEITDYFVDEVAEVTSKAIEILHSRCRYKLNEYDLIPKGLMSCNPTKGWLYNEFYLKHERNELPEHRVFVPALPTDNPYLPQTYIDSLLMLNEYDKQRLYFGNWHFDDDSDKLFNTDNLNAMFRDEALKGEMYLTGDIARLGKDKTVLMVWNGRTVVDVKVLMRSTVNETVVKIRELITTHNIKLLNVIVDEDGIGGGVVDFVKCKGFQNGSRAKHPEIYKNLKSECYYTLANFIESNKVTILAAGYKEEIIKELETVKRHKSDADSKLMVTPKEEIKRIHGFSPDFADCLMMRMYYELNPNQGNYTMMAIN